MRRSLLILLGAILLFAQGCANKSSDVENFDMAANLEPELFDSTLKDIKRGRPLTEKEMKALASQGEIQLNLDVQETDEVEMFFRYFAVERRGTMERWLKRAAPQLPYVRAVLASYNLPPDLIVLPFIESGYNTMAYSHAGAGGMWQFMPATGKDFGLSVDWWVDERRNPYKSTVAAAQYLSKLYAMFNDWNLALAAYNAGEGKVSRAMAASGRTDFFELAKNPKLLKQETRHYVPKFLAVLKILKNLDALGFEPVNWQAGQVMKEVSIPGGTDLHALADACGMSWEQFHEKNSFFRRQMSPPDRTVTAYVPDVKYQLAMNFLAHPENAAPAGYAVYETRPGENWWQISRRTGIPLAALRQCNASVGEVLAGGEQIKVPQHCSPSEEKSSMIAAASSKFDVKYAVRRGDTLSKIAARYNVGVQAIMKANRIKSARGLAVGQRLVIPGASGKNVEFADAAPPSSLPVQSNGKHVIQKGDTVNAIAMRYGVAPEELMRANNLNSPKKLIVGKKLVIPGSPDTAAVAEAAPAKTKPTPAPKAPVPVKLVASAMPAAAPAPAASCSHLVQKGDTVYSISKRYGVPGAALLSANRLSDPGKLRVGMKLVIPGAAPAPQPRAVAKATPTASPKAAPAKATQKAAPKSGKSVSYKVGKGDTVWGIAKKFNVAPQSLMAWNNLKSASALQAGANLKILDE